MPDTGSSLLLIVASSTVVAAATTVFGNILLKHMERKTARINAKEIKRIDVFIKLYSEAQKLSILDDTKQDEFLAKIEELKVYILDNGLFIDGHLKIRLDEMTDYYMQVAADSTQKAYVTENRYFLAIYNSFHK